jgi:hypothetical protein
MSKVWVVHPVRDDLSAACQWGTLTYINQRYVYGDELTKDGWIPRQFERALVLAARKFNPDNDFLMLVGDHVQVAYLAFLIAQFHGRCTMLRYDRHAAGYLQVRMQGLESLLTEHGLTGPANI